MRAKFFFDLNADDALGAKLAGKNLGGQVVEWGGRMRKTRGLYVVE